MSEQIIAQSAVAFYASSDYTAVLDMKTLWMLRLLLMDLVDINVYTK